MTLIGNYCSGLQLRREITQFLLREDPYGTRAFVRFGIERGEIRDDIDPRMIVSMVDWLMDRCQDAIVTEELDPGLFGYHTQSAGDPRPAGPRVRRAAAQRGRGAVRAGSRRPSPMPDGMDLAATLYLPDDRGRRPVPALLEYLPYRKDDAMLARDHDLYSYLTERGYAGARVDIRGTGRSGGTLPEGEYTETEQRDADAVIAWLASQPWCTGAVGHVGHLLGRLQRDPGGAAAAARAQGDHRGGRLR